MVGWIGVYFCCYFSWMDEGKAYCFSAKGGCIRVGYEREGRGERSRWRRNARIRL
jgi:hypothetical protein